MNEMLAWIDLETAGTDELRDPILEIAIVVTGTDLEELASYEAVVWPGSWDSYVRPDHLISPAVLKMHTDSGLLEDCAHHGITSGGAQSAAILTLGSLGGKGSFVLAGSGVSHFDRRFIRNQMPLLDGWLKYYSIDVGVLRRTLKIVGRSDLVRPAPAKPHRAMADVRLHIGELRYMKQALGPAAEILR